MRKGAYRGNCCLCNVRPCQPGKADDLSGPHMEIPLRLLMHLFPLQDAPHERNPDGGGSNIGTYNTHLRLQPLYHDKHGLHHESVYGEGTEVRMRIPAGSEISVDSICLSKILHEN